MDTRKITVLIVDDDEDYLFQTTARLRADGFNVLEANGEAAGLEAVERGGYDVAVFDLMMDNMDSGFILCHRAKRSHPDKPVLLVTGVAGETGIEFDAATREEKSWVKADALLSKPVRYEQVRTEIERLCPQGSAE